jgi:hypothetical protein
LACAVHETRRCRRDHSLSHPESAIEGACLILDDASDVFAIGAGPLTDSIDRDQIKHIYDTRKAARLH